MTWFSLGFVCGAAVVLALFAFVCIDDDLEKEFGIGKYNVRKFRKGRIIVKLPVSAFDMDKAEYKYITDARRDLYKKLELLVVDCDRNGDCRPGSSPCRVYAAELAKKGWQVLKIK
jgi:hypothetical protein